MQRFSAPSVALSMCRPARLAAVDAWDEAALTYEATGQYCPRFARTGILEAGSTIDAGRWQWQVIASPGHDPLSVALYQPELELLISADALWENGFGVVFPELEGVSAFQDVRRDAGCVSRASGALGHSGPRRALQRHGGGDRHGRCVGWTASSRILRKHALHAVKVLIKFRLLETQVE